MSSSSTAAAGAEIHVSVLGGNDHSLIGVVDHQPAFDFACARLDIAFLPSPPEIRDEAGMMLPHACHPDATHGNAIYGGHVLTKPLEMAA